MNTLDAAPSQASSSAPAFALLFPAARRPDAAAIENALADPAGGSNGALPAAQISFRPEGDADWLEILGSGLTFDISGLAPGPAIAPASARRRYGFAPKADGAEAGEAGLVGLMLAPGVHIAAGVALPPVMRTMAGLAARLGRALGAVAIDWPPAGTRVEPAYFARLVEAWLQGGAFPALGLTALVAHSDQTIASEGLSFFIGQEVRVMSRPGEAEADTAKLAIRVVDHFVRHGALTAPAELEAAGEALFAEPSQFGQTIWVWRKDSR